MMIVTGKEIAACFRDDVWWGGAKLRVQPSIVVDGVRLDEPIEGDLVGPGTLELDPVLERLAGASVVVVEGGWIQNWGRLRALSFEDFLGRWCQW